MVRDEDGVRDPLRSADSDAEEPGGLHAPTSGVPDAGVEDPDLVENLGPELDLRGDVLEARVAAAESEAAEARDRAARAQADFENAKKRLETRHRDEVLRAGERVVEALLPVLDDMERAIEHAGGEDSESAQGLAAVHRKMLDIIGREGASVIDPLGEPFDPARHNAVQMREDASQPDHTVVEVFQRGYEMHGRVLRTAMVVVSTGGPAGQ